MQSALEKDIQRIDSLHSADTDTASTVQVLATAEHGTYMLETTSTATGKDAKMRYIEASGTDANYSEITMSLAGCEIGDRELLSDHGVESGAQMTVQINEKALQARHRLEDFWQREEAAKAREKERSNYRSRNSGHGTCPSCSGRGWRYTESAMMSDCPHEEEECRACYGTGLSSQAPRRPQRYNHSSAGGYDPFREA